MVQKILEGMNIPWLVQVVIGVCIVCGVYFLLRIFLGKKKIADLTGKYLIFSLFIIACIQFAQLEVANHNIFFRNMSLLNVGINVFTLWAFLFLFYAVTNRAWLGIIVQEIVVTILGIGNYYVLYFRGTPITAQDIPSFTTALNVSSDLKFTLQIIAAVLAVIGIICVMYALFLRKVEVIYRKKYLRRGIFALASIGFLWFIYFCEYSPKPSNTSAWVWRDQYWKYGYTACSFESVQRSVNVIEKPEGYTTETAQEKMQQYEEQNEKEADGATPDIILILNETFYDFSLIHDFSTDEPVTPYLDSLENVIRGYVSVPTIGGGTNRSEYELLTSNSLYLMKDILPFWTLNFDGANSIVSLLKEQGYYTMALHQGNGENYNRDKKYVEMGFDEVFFEDDMGKAKESGRVHGYISDRSGYEFLIEKYEQRDQSRPFFAYNLTIQNHISNQPMDITVHTTSGFEGMQEQADIYLSCLQQSDEAFQYLTEYFSQIDRPVIICMIGDHGPEYAASVEKKDGLSNVVEKYGDRCTPIYIWSNQGLQNEDWGIISMPYVMPKLLQTASVQISSYYDYLNMLSEKVPILTAYDSYSDKNGSIFSYQEESVYSGDIRDYWYFEYYNVHEGKNRNNDFFELKK